MIRFRRSQTRCAWLVVAAWVVFGGCESAPKQETVTSIGPARRVGTNTASRPASEVPKVAEQVPSKPLAPVETQPASMEDIREQIPDPTHLQGSIETERDAELTLIDQRTVVPQDRARERKEVEVTYARRIAAVMEKTSRIDRPKRIELTMIDAVKRALLNNYFLQAQAYNPAVETTRIVEAEAQFDAVFFSSFQYDKQDQPTSSQLMSSSSDTRSTEAGVRKLLASGMQVQVSYALTRSITNMPFQTLNPAITNNLIFDFKQPLLQGFGLDYNRAQIENNRLGREISLDQLRKEIREMIFNVDQAYWRLYETRRSVGVSARLLTDLEQILEWLQQRKEAGYDVYGVQLNLTTSRIEQRRAQYIQRLSNVKNAEDTLKALMNDPEINLAEDIEIIPVDAASLEALTIDELGEIAAALQYRAELQEARHRIEQAKLAIGVAKNQALPKLDVMFRYVAQGLGGNWGKAFHQMTTNDFTEYVLGMEFEWPIGSRGPEAGLRRARLQQAQAIASQRAQIENIIREVRQAMNDLRTSYAQIGPALRAAQASRDQLRATKARQERLDPPSLQVELDAHEALAGARDGLLSVLANYNVALSDIERRKGTLLEYNNVVIRGVDNESSEAPYQPVIP